MVASSPQLSLSHPNWEEAAFATLVGYLDLVEVELPSDLAANHGPAVLRLGLRTLIRARGC